MVVASPLWLEMAVKKIKWDGRSAASVAHTAFPIWVPYIKTPSVWRVGIFLQIAELKNELPCNLRILCCLDMSF
jgi:hypothetical protein